MLLSIFFTFLFLRNVFVEVEAAAAAGGKDLPIQVGNSPKVNPSELHVPVTISATPPDPTKINEHKPGESNLLKPIEQNLAQCSDDHYSNGNNRFDCFPRGTANEEECHKRGCCWKPLEAGSKASWCFYPREYVSYKGITTKELQPRGLCSIYKNVFKSPYPDDVETLKVDTMIESTNTLRIKIYDDKVKRYESPYPKIKKADNATSVSNENFVLDLGSVTRETFGFTVKRKSNERVLFDTRQAGGFIFSDQYIQLSAKIASTYVYGLGEVQKSFLNNFDWTTFTFFNHDSVPTLNKNGYGSHPFYLCLEEDGKAHGVFLHNSNAIEVSLQPTPAITYRTMGGILDFYFFIGDSPAEVVQAYLALVGKPNFPPYWSLGFHLSKWGNDNQGKTTEVLKRNLNSGIPLDTLVLDIDYKDQHKEFTFDKEKFKTLPNLIKQIHNLKMKIIPAVSPSLDSEVADYKPFKEGLTDDIFIKNEDGTLYKGQMWTNSSIAYPDFTNPKAMSYWSRQLEEFYKDIEYDGIWLSMNEPSNLIESPTCPETKWDNPPYKPFIDDPKNFGLKYRTLCMSAKQHLGRHYDLHNVYGISESEATFEALKKIHKKKRPFILSRSTFSGSGAFANHWTGDQLSNWKTMRQSIKDILTFNILGIPMVGADICGYKGNATPELCARWSSLGAFYPFARNHNDQSSDDQDPAAPGMGQLVLTAAKTSLNLRYSLLPYLYTLFYKAHTKGETVARPLFFEFPNDKNTYPLEEQFMWGSALMIIPVLRQGANKVEGYLPQGKWYHYPSFKHYLSPAEGVKQVFVAEASDIPVLFRGGYTIVTQTADRNTAKSRHNPFQIYVALDDNSESKGELYWDNGVTTNYEEDYTFIDLQTKDNRLECKPIKLEYDSPMKVDKITILGIKKDPIKELYIETVDLDLTIKKNQKTFQWDRDIGVLIIDTSADDISLNTEFSISWVFSMTYAWIDKADGKTT